MRKLLLRRSALFAVAVGAGIAIYARQDKSERPSPPATAKCELAEGQSITVNYSRPTEQGTQDLRGCRALRKSMARRRKLIEGELELTIDGGPQIAKPGVVGIVPANSRHSVKALTNGQLTVVDHPARPDFG